MLKVTKRISVLLLIALMTPLVLAQQVDTWFDYAGNHCLELDGVDDYVGGFSGLEAQEFTIEIWVKPNKTIQANSDSVYQHEKGFLISVGNAILGYFDYRTGDFRIDLYIDTAHTVPKYVESAGSKLVWEPLWYHIAIVHDGSTLTCYVNTVVDLITPIRVIVGYTYWLEYYSSAVRIGTAIDDTNLAFGGRIDEIRYWNVSRSQEEITQAFNRTLNANEINSPNLIGYWRLDDDLDATSCHDFSLRQVDAQLGGSPSTPVWKIIPEFPAFLILPLFMTATLLSIIVYRMRKTKTK